MVASNWSKLKPWKTASTCNPENTSQPRCLQLLVRIPMFSRTPPKTTQKKSLRTDHRTPVHKHVGSSPFQRAKAPKKTSERGESMINPTNFKTKAYTLPETKIFASENQRLEDVISFGDGKFSWVMLVSRG